MKTNAKIILVFIVLVIILLAWAPLITNEYAKNKTLEKNCSSIYYNKEKSQVCMLNSNFQGGGWNGTGILVKDIAARVIWIPFGRYVTNFEGMEFVTFYGQIL